MQGSLHILFGCRRRCPCGHTCRGLLTWALFLTKYQLTPHPGEPCLDEGALGTSGQSVKRRLERRGLVFSLYSSRIECALISRRTGIWLLLAFTLIVGAAAFLAPRFDLPPSYHDFADKRVWLGIPHFGDVASNLLFAIAGLWGLLWLGRKPSGAKFVDPRERWPYLVLFFGLLLTAFGSSYYHL